MPDSLSPDHDLAAFFDTLAARWDAMQSPERDARLRRILEPRAAVFAGAQRILDVGSGTGAFLPHLHRLAPQATITALDLSRAMLRRAQTKDHTHRVGAWLRANALRLPVAADCIDLVTCHDSFAHLEDRPAALAEFRRVLVPGGRILILHDISRDEVNAIHAQAAEARVRTHVLPPVGDVICVMMSAGFMVLAAEDTSDHYLLAARLA